MTRVGEIKSFSDYRTVGEAADFLGVSRATLRNWDRNGKLKPRRHPQNGYRIYLHEDLEAVLRSAQLSTDAEAPFAPKLDWSDMGESDHFVQFYENDEFLIDSVSGYVSAALSKDAGSIAIATADHREAIERKLTAVGIDVAAAMERGRYVPLDAAETLSKFMVDGMPERKLFIESVGQVVARMARRARRIHAFGEMVALLWAEGNHDAAIRLEELWNELGKTHKFSLFCAYPIAGFDGESDADPFAGICGCHSKVIPAESYNGVDHAEQRLRAVAALQQKAQSLEAEIAHRKAVERALSKRERDLLDYFDEYLAKLGHGLRNPLAAVQSGVELLQMELGGSLAADEVLNVMQLQVAELVRLVDELPQVHRIAEASVDFSDEQSAGKTTSKTTEEIRQAHAPPTTSTAESAQRRILVVDDNQDSLDTLHRLLRMRKHEVRTARDGLEAIEIAAEFQPHVVLMDVGMPRLDGYEATRRIRRLPGGPDFFIVALTGWGQPSDIEQAHQAGCSAHLVKPVDFAELEQLVANCAGPVERS